MLYIGSQNLTATSLDDNREIGILISDPHAIARVVAVFASDLATAVPEEIAAVTQWPPTVDFGIGVPFRLDGEAA